ncbi:TRAP transporter large permease [Chelatococcus daeguensis]|uniref:TRAP transporter large permease protein n=2 Tax=Chelatococcus TaxID=28209 RepID=A0AAC9JM48_9HYPH|nr:MULTISPECIES: TRAP transporter large permease [Chelatococcus]APF36168.1 permease [Chelatococcus daeguensis]KZE35028.1 permease [Chelatococcus daeguensis]MBM3083030.1 TRAP transporter large permease [Chelatococcus daeguensis]CUA88891.1 TRAP transporter, DctM subunit [Chelatococcus sambhunathii]
MSASFVFLLAAFFGLAAIGMPIAYAMFVAAIGYLFVTGKDVGLFSEQILNNLVDSFVLLAVPLFILAANLMNAGGVSERMLLFCQALVGRFRGGLAHVNVVASIIFAGMSGSAIADAAGVGKLLTEMMVKTKRYTPGFAAAISAASSTIGPIIPPSIPMVLYALVSDTSVGYLFLGGIIPGLIMAGALMAAIAWVARKRDFPRDDTVPMRELPRATVQAFPALMLPVILLYGIYGGAATPTEAASLAALYALMLAGLVYRSLTMRETFRLFAESARSTTVVALIIAGAFIFNYIVASENIPQLVAGWMRGVDVHPLVFLLLVNLLFLALGCLFDATTMLLVLVPLFLPAAREMGIDLVHFGVVIVVNIMLGLVTPPYGVLLFVMNGLTGIPLRDIIREMWLFLFILLAALLLMILVPETVLWLPRQFGYTG